MSGSISTSANRVCGDSRSLTTDHSVGLVCPAGRSYRLAHRSALWSWPRNSIHWKSGRCNGSIRCHISSGINNAPSNWCVCMSGSRKPSISARFRTPHFHGSATFNSRNSAMTVTFRHPPSGSNRHSYAICSRSRTRTRGLNGRA